MYSSMAFEKKNIQDIRYTIALDFKKRTSPSPRESSWVRYSVVFTQIYKVDTSRYEFIVTLYFVEVRYASIS